jgi:hypothetical protein
MPSKQDIAVAKGLAKEAGKMVAEELAKMLIPGIGWVTGLVSVVKLVQALNDPGDESRPVELALRVAQDARFCVRLYDRPGSFFVLDFYDVNKGANKMPKTLLPNTWGKAASLDRNLVQVGKDFEADKFNTAGKVRQLQYKKLGLINYTNNPDAETGFVVGFNRSKQRDLELITIGADVLVAQLLGVRPELRQYETELLAGASISIAALKVSAAADLFDNDMKPKFGEGNVLPLIQYGEALSNYVALVKQLGFYPAGLATFGEQASNTALLGDIASQIANAFGLNFGGDYVSFKTKAAAGNTIRDIYQATLSNSVKTVPGTEVKVNVSMPGSPLETPSAIPEPVSLAQQIYVDRPRVDQLGGNSGLLQRISFPDAISKQEQQNGKLGLADTSSAAGEPSTPSVGRTDSGVLVLLAAAAAALALV